MPPPPPNSYLPGTKLSVGSHNITIIKYLSEGGFALVYTCTIDPPFQGSLIACLKRVAVPNKMELTLLRQEVDAMRRLRGNKHIVSYIDSHASRMATKGSPTQQYEVFLLMEYCENNGLIDLMNARLVNKLTEQEILTIMFEITAATAMCHHLQPPLMHRDIKIENVLIDRNGVFKLCDFGSSVGYIPAPVTPPEFASVREDIMQHTTPQYKAPEMIDLTRGFPIDDKLDVWALGIFMYKLCYYTTPFELSNHKSMQDLEHDILNSTTTLRFRDLPGLMFSSRLKNIIKCCLRDDPRRRPNAVQLLGEIAQMKGVSVPEVIPYSVRHKLEHSPNPSINNAAPNSTINIAALNNSSTPKIVINKQEQRKDPFSMIDKSSLLRRPKSVYDRPKSFIDGSYLLRNNSSSSIQDFIQLQIETPTETELPNVDQSTLDFLRGKEEENHRQDTGGSFKASLKILRKISTGGSITANHTSEKKRNVSPNAGTLSTSKSNGNHLRDVTPRSRDVSQGKSMSRSKSVTTSKSPSTKIPKNKSPPSDNHLRVVSSTPPGVKKLSIQRRMQILFKNDSGMLESVDAKTAKGYGKYTDVDEIDAINKLTSPSPYASSNESSGKPKLLPPKIPLGLSAKKAQEVRSSRSQDGIIKEKPKPERTTGRPEKYTAVKPERSTSDKAERSTSVKPSSARSEKSTLDKQDRSRTSTAQVIASYKLITPAKSLDQKPVKKIPPKPTKPSHLKAPGSSGRRSSTASNASDVSLPDLDDLEKQFSRRFPSYV